MATLTEARYGVRYEVAKEVCDECLAAMEQRLACGLESFDDQCARQTRRELP
jgi:hypothetical protein